MVDDGTWEMGVAIDARGCGSSNVAVGVLAGATRWRCGVVRGRPGVGVADDELNINPPTPCQ